MQDLYIRKKRVRSLPNVEALRKPWWMISDVHAISADIHNYRYSSWSKKFLRFLHSPNNCACRYCYYPRKSHRCLRSDIVAMFVAKVRNKFEIRSFFLEKVESLAKKFRRKWFLLPRTYSGTEKWSLEPSDHFKQRYSCWHKTIKASCANLYSQLCYTLTVFSKSNITNITRDVYLCYTIG